MNPKLYLAGGVTIILLLLTSWGFYERSEKLSIKSELAVLQAIHDEVVKDNKRKEVENNERLKTAATQRESLMRQLRDNQVRISTLQRTLTASGTGRACYDADGLNTAYGELVTEVRAIAGEGQAALINNKAWLESWPR
ncbi:MAG TPA: hypothetical protein VJ742_08520 [Nitrososphaera sp.]|nr:hypothetical protein [Nitrososphaera sp.]